MKKTLVTLIACAAALCATAQTPRVEINTATAADNRLLFTADIDGSGTFTVRMTFDRLENVAATDLEAGSTVTVATRGGVFYSLLPRDAARPAEATFTADWMQGALDAQPDADFVYRLPFAAGHTALATTLTPAEAGMMRANVADFRMWQFALEAGDDVYAMRRGTVIRIEGFGLTRTGGNTIVVEHADGTQASYTMLAEGSLQVACGDTVTPDTVLARAGQLPDGSYGVRVALYRYVTNRKPLAFPQMMATTVYMDPTFMLPLGKGQLHDGKRIKARVTRALIGAEE